MKNLKNKFLAVLALGAVTAPAHAGLVVVPEPGMLPLFGIAAIAFYLAKKRKK